MADMPGMDMPPPPPAQAAPVQTIPPKVAPMDMGGMTMMAGQLGHYTMTRDASGTSWQPDSTPMQGMDWSAGGWSGMADGYVDGVWDHQGGRRGATEGFSESMGMVMAQHAAGPGTLTLRTMVSLDPLMGPSGYPLLLQTGETANGRTPLIDRQHPHDLFMELAGVYSLPLNATSSAFLYVGYPGEPALGPVTFMHRLSGQDDPLAPITHHWLDSTHVTYGVVTAGFVHGDWKLEASAFNGREPDQHRWDFDRPRLDSYSARLSWNPTHNWALQVSYGLLRSPEQLEPETNQRRVTASATYNHPFAGGNWQTTLAWGRNYFQPGPVLDGFLLETAVSVGRHTVFARAESAQKNELFLPPSPLVGRIFPVQAYSLGYVYDIPIAKHLAVGLGGVGEAYGLPRAVQPAYGDNPLSYTGFVRLKII